MSKCRHKKRIILGGALRVSFIPDQEPYESGVIESCGIKEIVVDSLYLHYCPRCEQVVDIGVDGEIQEYPQ
jgi:hypothetical protein